MKFIYNKIRFDPVIWADQVITRTREISVCLVRFGYRYGNKACVRNSPNGTIGNFTNGTIGSQW